MRAELQLGLEIGAPRRMVPFLSAKSRIAWYNFLMIRFLNARNRLYSISSLHARISLLVTDRDDFLDLQRSDG